MVCNQALPPQRLPPEPARRAAADGIAVRCNCKSTGLGIVDSLQVKLIYTEPVGASRRLDALLRLLQRSLMHA